jgi:hypothetical protein
MTDAGHFVVGVPLTIYGVCYLFDNLVNNPQLKDEAAMRKRYKIEAIIMTVVGFIQFTIHMNLYGQCFWTKNNGFCNSTLSHAGVGLVLAIGGLYQFLFTSPFMDKRYYNCTIVIVFMSIAYNLSNHDQHGHDHAAYLDFIHKSMSNFITIASILHALCQVNTKFRMAATFFILNSAISISLGAPTLVHHFSHLGVEPQNVVFIASNIVLAFMLTITVLVIFFKKKNGTYDYYELKTNVPIDLETTKEM